MQLLHTNDKQCSVSPVPGLVRVLPNEVHVISLEPGRAPFVFTRTEALKLAAELHGALRLPEPYLPRLSWWRRTLDAWRRWRAPKPTAAQLARVRMLMGSGPTTRMVSK